LKLFHPVKAPHIAISVDMLDTGIDIPEVVNLVFSRSSGQDQVLADVGRGTRLRPIFSAGPGQALLLYLRLLPEPGIFSQNPETTSGALGESLTKKLFTSRVELISELDKCSTKDEETNSLN